MTTKTIDELSQAVRDHRELARVASNRRDLKMYNHHTAKACEVQTKLAEARRAARFHRYA